MMERMEILNSLERGEISVRKAVSLLKESNKVETFKASDDNLPSEKGTGSKSV
jgi:vacuolar-type H+-ATPase subunit H